MTNKKLISWDEIINPSPATLNQFKTQLSQLEKQIKDTALELKNGINNALGNGEDYSKYVKRIDALEQELKKLNTVRQTGIQLAEKEAAVAKELGSIVSGSKNELIKLTERKKEAAKVARNLSNENDKEIGAYKSLDAKLKRLRTTYKNVAAAKGTNSRQAKMLIGNLQNLDRQLKHIDKTAGHSHRSIGNYGSALKRLRFGFVQLAQSAGLSLGLFGVFRAIRSSLKIFISYEKEMATLQGITKSTKEQMKELDAQVRHLGETTIFTAGEVAQLQTAYARLGFTQEQILEVTEATLLGAISLQAELGEAAELVGGTIKAFGLDMSEAQSVVDKLSASTQQSALTFQRLKVSLAIVAPAARSSNISLNETLGLLAQLVDRGIDASTAGTSLRNVFLQMAKRGQTLEQVLGEIENSTNKNKTAFEIFGKRGAVVAQVLADTQKAADDFAFSMAFAGGAAEDLAEKQLDTLWGALKLLKSAYEGVVLSVNETTNASEGLKTSIRFLAKNLKTILKTILALTIGYGAYLVTIKAIALWQSILAARTRVLVIAKAQELTMWAATTAAIRTYIATLSASGWGLILGALSAIVAMFVLMKDGIQGVSKARKELSRVETIARHSATKDLAAAKAYLEIARDTNKLDKVRQAALNRVRAIQPELVKGITLQNIESKETNRLLEDRIKLMILAAKTQGVESLIAEQSKSIAIAKKEAYEFLQRKVSIKGSALGEYPTQKALDEFKKLQDDVKLFVKESLDLDKSFKDGTAKSPLSSILGDKRLKLFKNLNDEQRIYIDNLKRLALQEFVGASKDTNITPKGEVEAAKLKRKSLDLLLKYKVKIYKDESKTQMELDKMVNDYKLKLFAKQIEDRKKLVFAEKEKESKADRTIRLKNHLDGIENSNNADRLAISKLKRKQMVYEMKISHDLEIATLKKEGSDLEAIMSNIRLTHIDKEGKLTKEGHDRLLELFERQKQNEAAILTAKYEFNKKGLKNQATELKTLQINYNADLQRINTKSFEVWKAQEDAKKDIIVRIFIAMKFYSNQTLNYLDKQYQREIDMHQRKIDKQTAATDTQRRRAELGLQNTLKFEETELAKAEKNKLESEKKLARVQKARTLFNTYNSHINNSDDPTKALVNTIRDFAILESFAGSFGMGGIVEDELPSDGIFRGDSHSAASGGIPIRVEGKEGIFSTKEMANLGKDNFYAIKNAAKQNAFSPSHFSNISKKVSQPNYVVSNSGINELKEIKSAIQNQPSHKVDVKGIVNGMLEYFEEETRGNSTSRTTYRIAKKRL